jgi:hypothetical protein
MIIAAIIVENIRGDTVLEDQCAWYGFSYLIDTTLGLALAIMFIKLLDYVAHENDWLTLRHSGVYTGPDGYVHWAHQVLAWLGILTLVKIVIYLFMWLFSNQLAYIGGILFAPLQFNIRFELVFVMILVSNTSWSWGRNGLAASEHTKASDMHLTHPFAPLFISILSNNSSLVS